MAALARFTYIHSWLILGITVIVAGLATVAAMSIFDRVHPFDITDPDSEVARASAAAETAIGSSADPTVVLLVSSNGTAKAARGAADRLKSIDGVARVVGPGSDPQTISSDGTYNLVLGYLAPGVNRVDAGETIVDEFAGTPGVIAGGTAVAAYQVGQRSEHDTRRIELYAAPLLLLLLLVVFRTVVAAVMPLIVAGLSILLTLAVLRLLTNVTAIDLFALQTVTGLGTGLAINYSLFILARYREELATSAGYEDALVTTMRRAGRTVLFSAVTVAAALAALLVFPQPFLHSTGIAGGLVALFAGLIALVVLPAALALLGPSVDRLQVRSDPHKRLVTDPSTFWRRAPAAVCRRPVPALLAGIAVMALLAVEAPGTNLTTPNAGELPAQDSARQVAEATETEFPALPRTQLFAVVPSGERIGADERAGLGDVPGFVEVSRRQVFDDGGSLVSISGAMDPFSVAGQDFVDAVRAELPPGSLVGGRAAEQADQRSSILDRAPLAIGLIIFANLLLLFLMTRAIVLPLLAIAVNLLTVVAALGALTAVFTSETLTSLLGTEVQSGIDVSVPVISFAIAFGLSTDYGIFLFSRIREGRLRGASETDAIVNGVATTGRLISASAALMAIAVGAFVLSDLVIVKEFAVAIAVAVILDATVIRGLVIPASLRLLGRAAWWNPRSKGWPPAPRDDDPVVVRPSGPVELRQAP